MGVSIFFSTHGHLRELSVRFARESERIGHLAREDDSWAEIRQTRLVVKIIKILKLLDGGVR